MIRSQLPFGVAALSGLSLMMAGCGSNGAPTPAATETGTAVSYNTSAPFKCHAGKPWRDVQISESADVAPGATGEITVHAPPALPDSVTPARIDAYCSVDGQFCSDTSCSGHPPVDFIDAKGVGPVWESVRSTDGSNQIKFTMRAYNLDKEPHHVTLVLDVPPN